MASPGPSTRPHPSTAAPPAVPAPPREGLDVTTLILSAVASAAAAYVTSKVWRSGTLASAAMSPVIVALVKEGLRKPTDLVASTVPAPRLRGRRARAEELPEDLPERLAQGAPPPFPPPDAGAPAGPVRIYSTRARRLRWRLAVVTGLLGFLVCALLYTVPEVIAGRSVTHAGSKTTLWGGARHHHRSTTTMPTTTTPAAPTHTATTPTATRPTQTVTVPSQTVTVAPPTATTPPPATTTPSEGVTTTPAPAPAAGQTTTPGG